MNNLFQGRRLKYLLYFGALVTIGSAGFYIIGGEGWTVIILSIEVKLTLIGSHENLNDFKETINN